MVVIFHSKVYSKIGNFFEVDSLYWRRIPTPVTAIEKGTDGEEF